MRAREQKREPRLFTWLKQANTHGDIYSMLFQRFFLSVSLFLSLLLFLLSFVLHSSALLPLSPFLTCSLCHHHRNCCLCDMRTFPRIYAGYVSLCNHGKGLSAFPLRFRAMQHDKKKKRKREEKKRREKSGGIREKAKCCLSFLCHCRPQYICKHGILWQFYTCKSLL